MAAYAALVSLMNDLDLILNHPRHSFSFDSKQITSLSQTVHFLIDFMESHDSHGCSRKAAQVLESKVASAAHAAHDVIESHVVDQILAGTTLDGKARSYYFLDLQKAIDKIDFVKRKAMQFRAKSGLEGDQTTYSPPISSEPQSSGKNTVVGFDATIIRLMEMLTGEPSSLQLIPIVGMGGMGKTTLAKYAHDHLLIEQHFDVRLWTTISQEYSVETILSELSGQRKTIGVNVNELGQRLRKKLWGRRYIIILDDMWSVDAWDEIQMFLPDNDNGSRVIVTTRLSDLASYLSSSSTLEMKFLEESKSWELFCGKTFGEENCPLELEEIGKKIVKRCQGLPLSIVVIGGHLQKSSRAIEYWEKIANIMNPVSSSGEDEQCFKILSLSYDHLPVYLKPCFLYMGIFQEDRIVYVSDLVKLWVAEGFLKPKKGSSLEDVAEEYFKDLNDRNLILVGRRSWNGKAEVCMAHDIVRELCLKVSKREKFLCVVDSKHSDCLRRVAIPRGKQVDSDIVGALESAPLIRSVVSHGEALSFDRLSFELRLLRLSRHDYGACFPAPNFQQVNLRYLAAHNTKAYGRTFYLPWSISVFWNLQTLIISGDYGQVIVPYEIWEMAQLRHLDINRLCLPEPVPHETSYQQECVVLENLYTLSFVLNLKLTEEVCKRMPNIKKLLLLYIPLSGHSQVWSDYCPHNLGLFNKLENLLCRCSGDSNPVSFRFPTSIRELSLSGRNLQWEDLAVITKSLPHLAVLELVAVQGLEWDLAEEEFSCLKTLKIYDCEDLSDWNADSSHFPVLEFLDICYAPKLSEIPFDIGEIPTLERIKVGSCSASVAISATRIAVEQESLGNKEFRVDLHFKGKKEVDIFHEMLQEEGLTSNNLRITHDVYLNQ